MRLSATKSLMQRKDVIIVASVSCIYGIGDPVDYHSMILHISLNEIIKRDDIINRLIKMQYTRSEAFLEREISELEVLQLMFFQLKIMIIQFVWF